MQAPIELTYRSGLTGVLQRELALNDTRVRTMARITVCTVIVVALAMVFQIPLPAYVAYLVFLVSQEDAASTLVTSLGGFVAATLAVAVSLLLYVFDASEPALRIPLLALSTVAGTFLARASPVGPIAFLAGYVLVLSQTLLDDVPTAEFVTHAVLWLWVVVALPVGVTVLVNLLAGDSPVTLARKRAAQLIEAVASYVEKPDSADPSRLRDGLLALGQLKDKAFRWNKRMKAFASEDNRMFGTLLEVLQIARCLPASTSPDARQSLASMLREARRRFLARRGLPLDATEGAFAPTPPAADPSQAALRDAIGQLIDEASGNVSATVAEQAPARPNEHAAARAIANRAHARFAVKVMCAVLASYATYSLLDWPGIRTAVTTCFFVSLTTVGESVHKFTLRLSGALIGGLIAGLCIVFILPSLTDIGQLCLLVAVVSAFCAWVSTSSETIAYAGMQIAFAFFLGVLQGYGPASDLTVLRDRLVGIVVGNIWITIIFTTLWPVSAMDQTRDKWASTIKQLGELLTAKDATSVAFIRMEVCKKASQAALLNARSVFESSFFSLRTRGDRSFPKGDYVERLASAAFVVVRLKESAASLSLDEPADAFSAQRLRALSEGDDVSRARPAPALPTLLDQARRKLDEEIDHASRTI